MLIFGALNGIAAIKLKYFFSPVRKLFNLMRGKYLDSWAHGFGNDLSRLTRAAVIRSHTTHQQQSDFALILKEKNSPHTV
jgi:hypothetical protein